LKTLIKGLGLFLLISTSHSSSTVETIIQKHLQKYSEIEYFSAIQVSIKAGDRTEHYAVGKRSRAPKSKDLSSSDLFEIGSITKSFTAALAIIAETETSLKLSAKVRDYLSSYPHWGELGRTGFGKFIEHEHRNS
jgi:D-alanyl-D-alanine carboxypeptidase